MVKLTRIYTRGGDKGETSLGSGKRVAKHSRRVAAYGTVDEANAAVGMARLHAAGEPDAMLARPSRIRYIRDFADLTREAILEILNDTVKNKTLIPALVDLLKSLEIITVDIVKAIADEANLYNTADPDFFALFNIKKAENKFDIYEEVGEAKILVRAGLELDFRDIQEGYTFHLDNNRLNLGEIQEHDQEHRKVTTEFYDRKNAEGVRVKRFRVFYYETSQAYHSAFLGF